MNKQQRSRTGRPCARGSPEQQLDMCEEGPLRGDEIEFSHGVRAPNSDDPHPPLDEQLLEHNFSVDMSEEGREGAEETGDEHSMGLQSDEEGELQYDDEYGESDAGLPGDETNKLAHLNALAPGHHH